MELPARVPTSFGCTPAGRAGSRVAGSGGGDFAASNFFLASEQMVNDGNTT